MTGFAELQAFTNFTFLEGGSHPEELVGQAKHLGLAALAVTDRNSMAGLVRAHASAKANGVRFIPGVRLDLMQSETPPLIGFASLLAWPRTGPPMAGSPGWCRAGSGAPRRANASSPSMMWQNSRTARCSRSCRRRGCRRRPSLPS